MKSYLVEIYSRARVHVRFMFIPSRKCYKNHVLMTSGVKPNMANRAANDGSASVFHELGFLDVSTSTNSDSTCIQLWFGVLSFTVKELKQ